MIEKMFADVSMLGLLGWFLWFTVKKPQPRMLDRFTEEINKARDDYRDELATERESCNERLKAAGNE